uniref:Uncharacterized protein n=1 Tax=Solanum lycopersicum TaxID=4081 RepID=A0A3Q7I263_SOLLC
MLDELFFVDFEMVKFSPFFTVTNLYGIKSVQTFTIQVTQKINFCESKKLFILRNLPTQP